MQRKPYIHPHVSASKSTILLLEASYNDLIGSGIQIAPDYHSLLTDGVEADDENTDFHFSRTLCKT